MGCIPRIAPSTLAVGQPQDVAGHGHYEMHDTFRQGIRSVRANVISGHPLERSVTNKKEFDEQFRMAMHQSTQGFHSVMRLKMDQAYLDQPKRHPVMGTRNHAMDTLTGADYDLEFTDFINTEKESTVPMDIHGAMEVRLGMSRIGL